MTLVIKKIKPMYTTVVTTMDKYGVDELKGSLIDTNKMQGMIKEIQKVIAVGASVRDIEEGNLVKINPARYAVKKFREDSVKNDIMTNDIVGYNIPQVEIGSQTYLMLQSNDIEFVVTEYEEKAESQLIHSDKSIIH